MIPKVSCHRSRRFNSLSDPLSFTYTYILNIIYIYTKHQTDRKTNSRHAHWLSLAGTTEGVCLLKREIEQRRAREKYKKREGERERERERATVYVYE